MSTQFVRGRPQPRRDDWRQAPYIQKPRDARHSQIFWLNQSVTFNGVAGELTTALTHPEGFDCVVRGAWSDLTQARVQLLSGESDRNWSAPQIPIRAIAGNSQQAQPLVWLAQPILLQARATIQGNWLNSGAELSGRLCFYTEILGDDRRTGDGLIRVTESYAFWLLCDLSKVSSTTAAVNSDMLIWGATTNAADAIIGRVTDETTNYSWSSEQIPIRAMAGVDGQVQPVMRYRQPYLLPANVQLRVDVNTAVAGNYMAFLCERILS